MEVTYEPWKLAIDPDGTKEYYTGHNLAENKADNDALIQLLTEKQKAFFELLGVDLSKAWVEQTDYVEQMDQLCEQLFQNAGERVTPACYEGILKRNMELGKYERAEVWGNRFYEQYPDQLASYTLRLKLYFETKEKDKFFEVLDQLRASPVVVDNKTLELIRMIQR